MYIYMYVYVCVCVCVRVCVCVYTSFDLLARVPSRAAAAAATRGDWLVWSLERSQPSPFASCRASTDSEPLNGGGSVGTLNGTLY